MVEAITKAPIASLALNPKPWGSGVFGFKRLGPKPLRKAPPRDSGSRGFNEGFGRARRFT